MITPANPDGFTTTTHTQDRLLAALASVPAPEFRRVPSRLDVLRELGFPINDVATATFYDRPHTLPDWAW